MRPDEKAAQSDIERSRSTESLAKKAGKLALTAGSSALGIAGASRILPLLNEYVPVDTALKGISKVSPKLGEFLKKGQSMGLNIKEGFDFLRDQFQPKEEQPQAEQTKQSNPLQDFEMNYPELARGLMATIQNGQKPEAAAAILRQSTGLGKMVKKLEKETGKNFVDYVLELFGPNQQAQGQQPPQQQMQQQPGQSQQQPGQQGSNIDQELMAALDKILKM